MVKTLPTSIEKNIIDKRFSSFDNLQKIDKLTIERAGHFLEEMIAKKPNRPAATLPERNS